MRALLILALAGCSNDVDPRVISGGGIGDGEIDGEVNVYVIDAASEAGIAGATVEVGGTQQTTDATGLVTFKDVDGPQTIAVKATSYRSTVWVGANGANVTIPLPATNSAPPSAALSGTITGWESLTVPNGHLKGAIVLYSWSNRLGDRANNIPTDRTNGCLGQTCAWTINTRTGTVSLIALIVDIDLMGNLDPSDDVPSIIGYAYKTGITALANVSQSGLALTMVEAGNLETVTIDKGTPPPALTELAYLVGIELSSDETLQIPTFFNVPNPTSILAPKPSVFSGTATNRLTAVAQTTSGEAGAQSIVLRQGLTTAALAAGEWLNTPTSVMVTRTTASWLPVTNALIHTVTWGDANGPLLEITVFDATESSVEVPTLVALPPSGTLAARVQGIGADLDVNDFSLEDDSDLLWGVSAQPVRVP
jgi:hypothetical protein